MSTIKFLVFADFHYKKKMYASTTEHLEKIIGRAKEEKCDFILHEGDVCNDYKGSPEVIARLMKSELPVFGVYGNHELETAGNSMENVTPVITNMADSVVWNTPDGKIGNGSSAHYYYDKDSFRFIFLDTNYSLMPDGKTYEHNRKASWGAPVENTLGDSLGTEQLIWLEKVLTDAADKDLHCIVNAHASFCNLWKHSPDAEKVCSLYRKANEAKQNTVIMSINGHYHSNHIEVVEDVLFFDVNTAINGWWQPENFFPYADEKYTFDYTEYDENGIETDKYKMPLNNLSMKGKTLYFKEPLSAIVTIDSQCKISIKGYKTDWMYGIKKESFPDGIMPEISDYNI